MIDTFERDGFEIWFKRLCAKRLIFEPLEMDFTPPKRKPEERFQNITFSIPYDVTYLFVPCVY